MNACYFDAVNIFIHNFTSTFGQFRCLVLQWWFRCVLYCVVSDHTWPLAPFETRLSILTHRRTC